MAGELMDSLKNIADAQDELIQIVRNLQDPTLLPRLLKVINWLNTSTRSTTNYIQQHPDGGC